LAVGNKFMGFGEAAQSLLPASTVNPIDPALDCLLSGLREEGLDGLEAILNPAKEAAGAILSDAVACFKPANGCIAMFHEGRWD
jgi:hypothetical protein